MVFRRLPPTSSGRIEVVILKHELESRETASLVEAYYRIADRLMDKRVPRVRALKIGPVTDPEAEMGPLVTGQHLAKVRSYVDLGIEEGAKLVVDGRGLKLQGYENGFSSAGACSTR
jgi:malonate-semialdehyde dehydrogenase (acetylating)/methylmalonate-semialdehyde dehydrogenase